MKRIGQGIGGCTCTGSEVSKKMDSAQIQIRMTVYFLILQIKHPTVSVEVLRGRDLMVLAGP
jgi:hypothetical protein